MFDHISLGVTDIQRSRHFYDSVMAALGYKRVTDDQDYASGYGMNRPVLWVCVPLDDAKSASAGNGTHIAFAASSREVVQKFYDAAMIQGGVDAGKPGLRPEYHQDYYAAFVLDPDGHKIEAVCRVSPV